MTRRLRPQKPTVLLTARNAAGEWRTVHGEAPVAEYAKKAGALEAVADAIKTLERYEGPWVVMAISTPDRIFQDLQNNGRPRDTRARLPEAFLLGSLGRADLVNRSPFSRRPDERRRR